MPAEGVKLIDTLTPLIESGTTFFSFEYFPPKTDEGVQKLQERQHRMHALGPAFCDITWGAGGSTADLTMDIASAMQNKVGGGVGRLQGQGPARHAALPGGGTPPGSLFLRVCARRGADSCCRTRCRWGWRR